MPANSGSGTTGSEFDDVHALSRALERQRREALLESPGRRRFPHQSGHELMEGDRMDLDQSHDETGGVNITDGNPAPPNRRSLAQRARRERERAQRAAAANSTVQTEQLQRTTRQAAQRAAAANSTAQTERLTTRQASQRARRERERTEGNARSMQPGESSRRSAAQRARRERERMERNVRDVVQPQPPVQLPERSTSPAREHIQEVGNLQVNRLVHENRDRYHTQHEPMHGNGERDAPQVSRRSLAQRERRERERAQRQANTISDITQQQVNPPIGRNNAHQPQTGNAAEASRRRPHRRDHIPEARRPYQDPAERDNLGRMDIECRYCGALHWRDEATSGSERAGTLEFGTCCDHGQVVLPLLQDPPEPLRHLFVSQDPQGVNFREHIWQYNRALSFTSLGVHQDHSVNNGSGEPVFRIHGEICHLSGALLPAPGRNPRYAQLYIYDPQEALRYRMANNAALQNVLREDTMLLLQTILMQFNRYAAIYRHAFEFLRRYHNIENFVIRLQVAPGRDPRRFNRPTVDEVAVILPGSQAPTHHRDIILRLRGGGLQRISDCHPSYAPLAYVVLFPYGEDGWHPDIPLRQLEHHRRRNGRRRNQSHERNVSQTRYVAFRLQARRNEFSCLLHGGRLLQRYMVDMFASADQNRLYFIEQQLQPKLRALHFSGLQDAMNAAGDEDMDLNAIGQRVILPSSYVGGPRHMQQQYQDSMAIARYYRKVDLFITVTCNPNWPEITRELHEGQTAYSRPDIAARVFNMKKKRILDDILSGKLGRVVAHVYTIEYQKRGLPHMHLLVFFAEQDKLYTPEAIDSLIWAHWPDPQRYPKLHESVKKFMVHGPCSPELCMKDGKCTKHFPKPFRDRTVIDVEGYPEYYRPNNGITYEVRGQPMDNSWLVAYMPYFMAKYDCHINGECAVSFGCFKYLFEYIKKGGDMATVELHHGHELSNEQRELYHMNEVRRWIDGRYISATEAAWCIFHFGTHGRSPPVVRLQVHLPGQHTVLFNPDEDPHSVLQRGASTETMLTAFFKANSDEGALGEEARKYTYQEFPQHFRWDSDVKGWIMRKQNQMSIGRMYFVSPVAGEKYYLRTLLSIVRGPRSYDELLTYNGTHYRTFQEACLARGLLEDDGEWRQCLLEAGEMQTGSRLRTLFATMLIFCNPTMPGTLWLEFRHQICDDLRHRLQTHGRLNPSEDDVYDYGLYLLNQELLESGYSLSENFKTMPQIKGHWETLGRDRNPLIAEQLNYTVNEERQLADQMHAMLNDEQRHAYHRVMDSVHNNIGKTFFLNGPGGTGKTFVYRALCHAVRAQSLIALVVASSGIAALIIPGGRTSHSMLKIPVENLSATSFCSITKESCRGRLICEARLLIWDEVVMQHRWGPEAFDRTCRDLRDMDKPFGGLTVVFGGDSATFACGAECR